MNEIENSIPHRPPFLFVDKIQEQTNQYIKAYKQINPDESFFKGHYPNHPIMPGVLICESIFQTGAILISKRIGGFPSGVPVLTRIQNVKFKNPVYPGDQLEMEVHHIEAVGPAHYMKGKAFVNGKPACSVEFTAMMMEDSP